MTKENKEENIIQGSAQWLFWRRKYICASDSISLMGKAPSNWKKNNSYHIWLSKQDDYIEEEPNFYMKRGKELEPIALKLFEQKTGYLMSPRTLVSDSHNFMAASLDGLDLDGEAAVEIKCSGKKDHNEALLGKVPEKYMPQLQHQMSVTGLSMIYYFAYSPESQKIIEVCRDEEYIKTLIEKESHFYHHHMLKKIAPENVAQIKKIDSQNWKSLVDEYKKMDAQSKASELRKKEIKDLLVQISNSENACGHGISLQRIERKGIIPYSSIPSIKLMDLEKYRKPSTSYWNLEDSND